MPNTEWQADAKKKPTGTSGPNESASKEPAGSTAFVEDFVSVGANPVDTLT